MLFQKPRSRSEIINDLDGEIVNLFRVLRDPCQSRELERLVRLTPFARGEFEAAYVSAGDPIECARRLIVRSFMGFSSAASNTGHRTGFRGQRSDTGISPASDWVNYPGEIVKFTSRLAGVTIENRPALDVIRRYDGVSTLHYVDPPYVMSTRSSLQRDGCYSTEMSEDDHRELATTLFGLQGMVVLSGYPSTLYDDELYASWRRIERATHAAGALDRTEVLWLNDAAASALESEKQQIDLF